MNRKLRKIIFIILIVLLLIPLTSAIRYFITYPSLIGYSDDKDWKVEYATNENYGEVHLVPLKKGLGLPKNLTVIEGNQRYEYPGKASKNKDDSRLFYYCHTLSDRPKENTSYKFEFISNDGEKILINLKIEKFSFWKIFYH